MLSAMLVTASVLVGFASAGTPATENGFAPVITDQPVPVDGGWQGFYWSGSTVYGNPFTFTAVAPAILRVTDAYCYGDQFSVAVTPGPTLPATPGSTSAPGSTACGGPSNPDAAFADPAMSHGCWVVAPGAQSVTIGMVLNPFGGGGAYIRVDTLSDPAAAIGCLDLV